MTSDIKSSYFLTTIVIIGLTISISSISQNLEKVWADGLIGNLAVGNDALALEYNPSNQNIYMSYGVSEGYVVAINSETNVPYAAVEVGQRPIAMKYNPSNEDMYVLNRDSGSVSVIDSANNTVISTIGVGLSPRYIEYNPANENIYVANEGTNSVTVIDSKTNTIIGTIDVGAPARILKFNPGNENLYVAVGDIFEHSANSQVIVIDSKTNTIVDTITNATSLSTDIEYNPATKNIYVANRGTNSITVIDSKTNTIVDTINLNNPPSALQYNAANNELYAAVENENSLGSNGFIIVIDGDTNIVKAVRSVGILPGELEYNPSNNNIYVANFQSNDVYVLDKFNKILSLIQVDIKPIAIKYNPSNNNIYVANFGEGTSSKFTLSIISTNSTNTLTPQDEKSLKIVKPVNDSQLSEELSIPTAESKANTHLSTGNNLTSDKQVCGELDKIVQKSSGNHTDKIITPSSSLGKENFTC